MNHYVVYIDYTLTHDGKEFSYWKECEVFDKTKERAVIRAKAILEQEVRELHKSLQIVDTIEIHEVNDDRLK